MLNKKIILKISAVFLFLATCTNSLFADITSVSLTALDSPTTLSNGRAYFLAGRDYRFRVQATAADNTLLTDWNSISININQGAATLRAQCIIDIASASMTGETNLIVQSVTNNLPAGPYTNIDFTIRVRFTWNNTNDFAQSSNNITATVTEDAGTPALLTDTLPMVYGLSTHIDVYNFTMSGDASDARINPYHTAFNVNGSEVVYYLLDTPAAGASDNVRSLATDGATEITGATTLLYNAVATAFSDADETAPVGDKLTYSVTAAYCSVLGDHTFRVRAVMNTGVATVDSSVPLNFNVNRVQISNIEFFNGGGIDTPVYYRSVNVPGTMIRVSAQIENNSASLLGNRNMKGNTIITVRRFGTADTFTVQIPDNQSQGTAVVTTPVEIDITDGTTQAESYEILSITGSAYDNEQNIDVIPGSISQLVVNPAVYWDDRDPPGNNGSPDGDLPGTGKTPFTTWVGFSQTATTITLNWTPLSTATAPPYDRDFYSYRIYYKKSSNTTWTMIDRSVSGFGPTETYDLSNINTGSVSIENLQPFTNYDYYITAIDIFGQEVDTTIGLSDTVHANSTTADYSTISTNPYEVTLSITDGITIFDDSSFNNETIPVPGNRTLRNTSIKVTINWISVEESPDSVNLILSSFPGPNSGNMVTGGLLYGTEGVDYDRIACNKTAPNTWSGLISTTNRYMIDNADIKFIIESIKAGARSYVDHDADFDSTEQTPPGDPNDMEWTYHIGLSTAFTPWPVRILNNVITDENPVAYPSYYLTEDATVTIKVYDIKGRIVAILLDNAYRKAGQNIKEQGWRGTNKNNRKLGVGLYYIHIEAKSTSNGKVILNTFKKVVMAK